MRNELRSASFSEFNHEIEKAIWHLPEPWPGAHDLYAAMLCAPVPKRIELVTRKDEPTAVVALVPGYEPGFWQPINEWMVPRFLCPCAPGLFWNSLQATRLPIRIGWRHMAFPPDPVSVRDLFGKPTYGVKFPFDYRAYWKTSGHSNTVHQKRKKCSKFVVKVNEPGAAEWIISNWKLHWDPGSDGSEVRLRMATANWLEKHGRHFALVMYDGERPIAGHTLASTAEGDVYAWQVTYKDAAYDNASPGTALMAHMFEWVEKSRPDALFDLGVDHAYKLRWAPVAGQHQDFTVSPFAHHASRKAAKAAGQLKKKVLALRARLAGPRREA